MATRLDKYINVNPWFSVITDVGVRSPLSKVCCLVAKEVFFFIINAICAKGAQDLYGLGLIQCSMLSYLQVTSPVTIL